LRARRRSAPFGWDRHPFTLGLTHAPTRTTQPALPAAVGWRRQLAAGTEASRRHEAGSESYRDGAPLRAPRGARLGWAPSCACESADAPLAVHLAALCPSRLLAVTTSPSRCAVRPPGQGCGRPRRAIDVHTSEDVGASKGSRWLLFCNQQFSMSTRESLRLPICSRRASYPRLGSWDPAALRGQVLRRSRETPPRRGFGTSDSDDGAVGPRRRSRSGSLASRSGSRSGERQPSR
jgi:hypothetical protein